MDWQSPGLGHPGSYDLDNLCNVTVNESATCLDMIPVFLTTERFLGRCLPLSGTPGKPLPDCAAIWRRACNPELPSKGIILAGDDFSRELLIWFILGAVLWMSLGVHLVYL